MVKFKYFRDEEFKRACPSCSLSDMDLGFMVRLNTARDIAGIPFVVNSAYRTKDYELSKGRSGTSSHCKGIAVDIRCSNSADRFIIVRAAIGAGFRRIGIGSHFIHLDTDDTKSDAVWLY